MSKNTSTSNAAASTTTTTTASNMNEPHNELEKKLQELSEKETEQLVTSFKDHFDKCTKACKKPNILLAGGTGAGKSSLINAVFGQDLAQAGVGMPVTQHFQKYEPADKPVVIYDAKGLEFQEHEQFIRETAKFFSDLRKKPDVADHIHVIWYVINTAKGRFDQFEADLISEVFAPTPVVFVLNKSDIADSKQIKACKKVIEDHNLSNNKGIHITISKRENWTQSWCPDCLTDDIFYDEETKELECSDCGFTAKLKDSYGMKKLIQHTVKLLPELAKDAFMYSQTASISEKDKRAKNVVKDLAKGISLDSSGAFIKKVAEMCAKLFVIWGWPLTADTFREGLAQMQQEYVTQLKFKERLAAAALDKLLGSRLSKAFSGLIGMTMNRGMKKLNQQLIKHAAKGDLDKIQIQDFIDEADLNEDLIRMFFETAMFSGVDQALDKYWELTIEELEQMATLMNSNVSATGGMTQFGNLNISEEQLKQIMQQEERAASTELDTSDVKIGEVTADQEPTSTTTTTTSSNKEEQEPLLSKQNDDKSKDVDVD